MGLFLQTVIIPQGNQAEAAAAMEHIAKSHEEMELDLATCQYRQRANGVQILCTCMGYDSFAAALSLEIEHPILLLYIYDEDFWGYYLYENGTEIDQFCPMPEYFEECSEEEAAKLAGDPLILAQYFTVHPEDIQKYLRVWTDALMDEEGKAYPEDEFSQCDCWQMADFMEKLGFPYDFPDSI